MQLLPTDRAREIFKFIEKEWSDARLSPKERQPKFRSLLETLFTELTSGSPELGQTDLFGRMDFAFSRQNLPDQQRREWHGYRKFLNRVVHKYHFCPTREQDLAGLRATCEMLARFSGIEPPEVLRAGFSTCETRFSDQFADAPEDFLTDLRMFVVQIRLDPAGRFCDFTGSSDELGGVRVRCWHSKNPNEMDWTVLHELAAERSNLAFTELRRDEQDERFFHTTPRTMAVLEPDYLMEAKKLSECWQPASGANANIHLLKRFENSQSNHWMLTGILVGHFFDDLLAGRLETVADERQSLRHFAEANAFAMLVVGRGSDGCFDYEKIKKEVVDPAREQIQNLKTTMERFKNWQKSLEPSFISQKYGLSGRLDALLADASPDAPNRLDIIELKSGTLPRGEPINADHAAQARFYSLLIEEIFPERCGATSVFYSQANPEAVPLREVDDTNFFEKQQLVLLRNRVVAMEMRLACSNFLPFENLENEKPYLFKYSGKDLVSLQIFLKTATPLERDYFLEFVAFIFREMKTAKMGSDDDAGSAANNPKIYSNLWRLEADEKERQLEGIFNLPAPEVEKLGRGFHLKFDRPPAETALRDRELVVVYPSWGGRDAALKTQILKGTIEKLTPEIVEIGLRSTELDPSFFKITGAVWAVEKDFSERGFNLMLRSMLLFAEAPAERRELLLGLRRPVFSETKNHVLPTDFPESHVSAVRRALSAEDYFLIQGPPGTGKTSRVLTEIVAGLVARGESVLVVAFTNRAVDEICSALGRRGISHLRMGYGGTGEHRFDRLVERFEKLGDLHRALLDTPVFVGTQNTLLSQLALFELKNIGTVVVDEASQLIESQLIGFLTRPVRFILIGDEKQLPPVVAQPEIASRAWSEELHEIGLPNLRESLFYRLLKNAGQRSWSDCHAMLTRHFRMHEQVADFVNRYFYENRLEIGRPDEQQAPNPIFPLDGSDELGKKLAAGHVVFFPSEKESTSKTNDWEARKLLEVARYIRQNFEKWYHKPFDETEHLGIITPFRAQVGKIRQVFGQEFRGVTVDTVERFQGSERDFILISFAVNKPAQIPNLQAMTPDGQVDRKLNVVLSRARRHLIFTGCTTVLQCDPFFQKLISSQKRTCFGQQ